MNHRRTPPNRTQVGPWQEQKGETTANNDLASLVLQEINAPDSANLYRGPALSRRINEAITKVLDQFYKPESQTEAVNTKYLRQLIHDQLGIAFQTRAKERSAQRRTPRNAPDNLAQFLITDAEHIEATIGDLEKQVAQDQIAQEFKEATYKEWAKETVQSKPKTHGFNEAEEAASADQYFADMKIADERETREWTAILKEQQPKNTTIPLKSTKPNRKGGQGNYFTEY